jgi:hypothetical protein
MSSFGAAKGKLKGAHNKEKAAKGNGVTMKITKYSKLWQSIIAYYALCAVFENGKELNKAARDAECYKYYCVEVTKFLNKESTYEAMTEYRKNEFSREVLMLSKGVTELTGTGVYNKGFAVRSEIPKWLASNGDFLKKKFWKKKGLKADDDSLGQSEASKNSDAEKDAEIEFDVPSGTNKEALCNEVLLMEYNSEMRRIFKTITIDDDDNDDDDDDDDEDDDDGSSRKVDEEDDIEKNESEGTGKTRQGKEETYVEIEDVADIPAKYMPSVPYLILKYSVILVDESDTKKKIISSFNRYCH